MLPPNPEHKDSSASKGVSPSHLLTPFGEIRAYQEQRERKLAKDYGAAGFTVTPRKRH
jgi:hypothetical protein